MYTFSPHSCIYIYLYLRVGVHWSMFTGQTPAFFHPSSFVSLMYLQYIICTPLCLTPSPSLCRRRHRIFSSLHRRTWSSVDCGDEPHITRGGGGFSILSRLVWPCEDCPSSRKESRALPLFSAHRVCRRKIPFAYYSISEII